MSLEKISQNTTVSGETNLQKNDGVVFKNNDGVVPEPGSVNVYTVADPNKCILDRSKPSLNQSTAVKLFRMAGVRPVWICAKKEDLVKVDKAKDALPKED